MNRFRSDFKQMQKICYDIYTQMFREAEPSCDFEFAVNTYNDTDKSDSWMHEHYLKRGRQLGIIQSRCKENKCNHVERRMIEAMILGGGIRPSENANVIKALEELK